MLVQKEVIRDGTYFYVEQSTGLPRKLVVTPELRKHWHDQGNAMLSDKLPIPVPYEHDFSQHPMTPKEALLNNSGEVKEFKLDGNKLLSIVDITDSQVAKKIDDKSVRWTSPWFNSFTDGNGKEWKNVISHLALTTRPRVTKQESFSSIAAALSMATEVKVDSAAPLGTGTDGFCLSRAGYLTEDTQTKNLRPQYPIAFSLLEGGIPLSEGDMPPKKKSGKTPPKKKEGSGTPPKKKEGSGEGGEGGGLDDGEGGEDFIDDEDSDDNDFGGDKGRSGDDVNDVSMEEILCDLLGAIGVKVEHSGNKAMFKRELYNAAMTKIHELAAVNQQDPNKPKGNRTNPVGQPPNKSQANPLINQVQQEQQPMYMSLEDINKIPDEVMKGVALSMYAENQKLRAEMEVDKKVVNSLRDAKLKEATTAREARVGLLGRLSPRVKVDLDAMLAMPSMALSMGDGGTVVDPMAQTIAVLEKGLADMPRLLTTDHGALSLVPQPKDADELTA